MSEFGINAAKNFSNAVDRGLSGTYRLSYSNSSNTAGKATDAKNFGTQLVQQVNLNHGQDGDSRSISIDEFTSFASGGKFKSFSEISNSADKAVIRDTFNDISRSGSKIRGQNFADFLTQDDQADSKIDGRTTIDFLV